MSGRGPLSLTSLNVQWSAIFITILIPWQTAVLMISRDLPRPLETTCHHRKSHRVWSNLLTSSLEYCARLKCRLRRFVWHFTRQPGNCQLLDVIRWERFCHIYQKGFVTFIRFERTRAAPNGPFLATVICSGQETTVGEAAHRGKANPKKTTQRFADFQAASSSGQGWD